jgi:molybdenum cofactor cytidylyltransferase
MQGGETLLARAIRLASEAGAAPVIVVLGAHHDHLLAAIPFSGLNTAIPVINGEWEQGIASSIRAALGALDDAAPEASGALILGCDQPRLTAEHLRALLDAFAAQAAPGMVASAYAGVVGIPAVFPCAAFADLLALSGDKGARAAHAAHLPADCFALRWRRSRYRSARRSWPAWLAALGEKSKLVQNIPQWLKPTVSYRKFTARLKPCPFKARLSPKTVKACARQTPRP